MNRTISIIIGLIVVALLAIGLMVFLSSRSVAPVSTQVTPAPSTGATNSTVSVPNDRSQAAVRSAYSAEVAKYPGDHTKLYDTVIVGDYALQVWGGDTMGGQALLQFDTTEGKWILLDGGGGRWSVETLVDVMGVPQATAEALLAGLAQ